MSEEQERHAAKYQYGKLCGRAPRGKCKCGNDYFKICAPGWKSWTFAQKSGAPKGASRKKYEAHHILCWSPVAGILLAPKAKPVVKGTKWCINNKTNMVALPLWGHTVKWYTNNSEPPEFMNLPQHDIDHNCTAGYTAEVEKALNDLVKNLKKANDAHKLPAPEDIAGTLQSKSSSFRTKLRSRGLRSGGTDAGWEMGKAKPASIWNLPFSMAKATVTRKFPRNFKDKRKDKLDSIKRAQALLGG